ncbi:MAG: hypothetical protein NT151_07405 [Acidobacteria bacterium]|nr:hypothetical protein [Acidobacteriota bacterium]
MRTRSIALLSAILVLASTLGMSADVKSQQKTQIKLEGIAGSVAGMFGGKAAKEGTLTTIAIKGNRRMSTIDNTAELIDLDAQKVYRLDLRGKTYTVQTFDELRAAFQKTTSKGQPQAASEKSDGKQPEMEFDLDIKKTGQQKPIAGFSCEQVIMTLTMHEKGKTVDDAGGMIITSDMWMAPKNPALQENIAFERRYFEKVYGDQAAPSGRDLAQAMAVFPGMQAALARTQKEGLKLDGTPMLTTVTVAGASGPEGSDARADQNRGGGGGIGGALGGLLGRKKKTEQPAEGAAGGAGTKTRATIMTTITEVLSIESAVAAGDVEIPAGFRQK